MTIATNDLTPIKTAIIENFVSPCADIDLDVVDRNIAKAHGCFV